jgi:hypothetical protein
VFTDEMEASKFKGNDAKRQGDKREMEKYFAKR